ncbi:hypothetical protein [Alicyclobacillus sendaiensis]|uniref:hypothetical protein n=1 Tax=Alicyclobacillus sendaiensis TaxID=192387 RepID=UPI000AB30643|nr:hypothetical protein [Alicyclobacillus sendaiensis]
MIEHIVVPIDYTKVSLLPGHREWIQNWLYNVETEVEHGRVASSVCLQAIISELVLYGSVQTDWIGIMDELLTDEKGSPLAYSQGYGAQLYNFEDQWKQTPVHAVYTRWWSELISGLVPREKYADLIQSFIQPNGWIYNPQVSPTNVRTRMRSELMMSLAMGIQILSFYNSLEEYVESFIATLSGQSQTGYISAEYFRVRSLDALHALNMIPVGLDNCLQECEAGKGYADFSVDNKMDEYMGTQKRVDRDKAVHSPLITVYACRLSNYCSSDVQLKVNKRLQQFGVHLANNPFDIPAFRMRDIEVPFGTDITPIELICASYIVNQCSSPKTS